MRAFVLASLLLAGCQDGPDDMSRRTVANLPKHPGDAIGYDWTDAYQIMPEVGDCDCPPDIIPTGCPSAVSGITSALLPVTQADGLIMLSPSRLDLLGPVNMDGSFAAGAVVRVGTIVGDLDLVIRVDGRFDWEDEGRVMTGVSRSRLSGEAATFEEGEPALVRIDCTETQPLRAVGGF